MTPANLLFLEPLLKAQLRTALDARVHVLSAAELEGVAEATQPTPAVHVLYRGFQVRAYGSSTMEIDQYWLTVVAVRNARDPVSAEAARTDAGPLAMAVIDALLGREFDDCGPLAPLQNPPAPGFSAGHLYLPLGWRAPITLERLQCLD